MTYEQKPMTGSLFKNDKGDNPDRPDIKGSALIDGVEYWVGGWVNEAKPKEKKKWRLSLTFQHKDTSIRKMDQPDYERDAPEFRDEIPL